MCEIYDIWFDFNSFVFIALQEVKSEVKRILCFGNKTEVRMRRLCSKSIIFLINFTPSHGKVL